MFRCVVELELVRETPGFRCRKRLIERGGRMGVQIVQHDADHVGVRKMHINEGLHLIREIVVCPTFRYGNVAPALARLETHKQVAGARALVLVIFTCGAARCTWARRDDVTTQLVGQLVKADHGTSGVVWLGVQV